MGLFDLLQGARNRAANVDSTARSRLLEAWGLTEEPAAEAPSSEGLATDPPLDYDRAQWVRRLKHILDELPESEPRWEQLTLDARAKGFDPSWVQAQMLQEFTMLVRQAVSDRVFTDREKRKLEMARTLVGLDEAQAGAIYASVVKEAETFFGEQVEGA